MKSGLGGNNSIYGKAVKVLQTFLLIGRSQMTEQLECQRKAFTPEG